MRDGQRHSVSDVIVIYDATHGSLRLSEPLYDKLELLLGRLRKAVDMTPKELDLVPEEIVSKLENWYNALHPELEDDFFSLVNAQQTADGWLQIYSAKSVVAKRDTQGVLRDIEIVGPEFVAIDGPPKLFYRYKVAGNGTALAASDAIEAVGDQWSICYWNPTTNEYKEAADDLVVPKDRPVALEDSENLHERS